MDLSAFVAPIVTALQGTGVATADAMRDDMKMRSVARFALEASPAPLRMGVKMTIGEAGFERLVLSLRDHMLEKVAGDPNNRNVEALVSQSLASLGARLGDFHGFDREIPTVSVMWAGPGLPNGLKEIPVGRSAVIGRHASCDLCLADASVSRQHARIEIAPSTVIVEDLNSTNGIWLGGQQVPRADWAAGQNLVIGKFILSHGPATPVFNLRPLLAMFGPRGRL